MSFDLDSFKAVLARRQEPQAVEEPTPPPPIAAPEAGDDEAKKETPMADTETPDLAAIQGKATEDATAAANARLNAVLASEHYAGREQLAATLMKSPAMSAEDIIAALAVSPAPAALSAAKEEADGDAMLEAIKAGNAPPLGAGGGEQGQPAAKQNSWDAIYNEMNLAA